MFPTVDVQNAISLGRWQGGGYYKPDFGVEFLLAQISGRLFTFTPQANNTVLVAEVTIAGNPNSATAPQCWMWQSEKWMIINDGTGVNPIFFDGTVSVRSNYNTPVNFNTTTAVGPVIIPNLGATVVINVVSAVNVNVGDVITLKNFGQFIVQSIAVNALTCVNQSAGPVNASIPVGTVVTWSHLGTQLPPGRMGCYGLGRNWQSLVDGKQFVAGDLVGGASGTQALNYRDAVLNITENQYLAGGGNFTVPGSVGEIQAMLFQALLDQQLGQGPLLVVTPTVTFSCQAPLDRTTWTSITNPILTEGMIANGGLSQNSTLAVNGDTIMRAVDGVRSMILARRDFNTWGNTPISFEMNRVLPKDDPALLPFGSAVFFDNRLMMTMAPTVVEGRGVYHKGLAVLNADPLSGIAGKAPSIWEGIWTGVTPFQIVTGLFSSVQRCWAFTYNTTLQTIELRELLAEGPAFNTAQYFDDVSVPITWSFESGEMFKDAQHGDRLFKQLQNGEIFVDQMVGIVDFKVQYAPDQWPGWVDWFEWQECSSEPVVTDPTTRNFQPGFKPRMGLGIPDASPCDNCTNRQMRLGYSFQTRYTITGQARFLGARLSTVERDEPYFAPQTCIPACAS